MEVSQNSGVPAVAILAKSHRYDAFISYSHKADSELAKVLQVRLERWARPWFAARTAKLFRDQVSLTATPHLWTTIAASLDNSEYLILLASTDSAKSEWVPRELTYWLSEGKCENPEELKADQVIKDRVERLMIVLTEGQIEWSHADGDFDWSVTNALPHALRKLPWQPLWTDLRWARGMKAKEIEADDRFTEPVLKLLSPIRGKTPQELMDANDKEQKRAVSLFRRLSIGLAVLFVVTLVSAWFAFEQRNTAEQRLAETRLQNARRSLLSDGDVSAGALWLAETLQTSGSRADASRQSARLLLAGWQDSLPLHALVHGSPVNHISWSADGRKIASASGKQAYVWDVAKGAALGAPIEHDRELSGILFSPDGKSVVTSTSDPFTHEGQVFIWDLETQSKHEVLKASEIFSVSFRFDGKALVVATVGGAHRFDTETGQSIGKVLPHDDLVLFATFSPDGKTILSGNGGLKGESEGDLRVWDAESCQLRFDPIAYEDGATAFFSPKGNVFVVAYGSGKIESRDTATGKVNGSWETHNRQVLSLHFSSDGHLRETSCNNGLIQIWDLNTQELVSEFQGHRQSLRLATYSSAGQLLATASNDGTSRLWQFVPSSTKQLSVRQMGNVTLAEFSPGNQELATVDDATVRLWRVPTVIAAEGSLKNESTVTAITPSSDERMIAVGCADGTTWSWDLNANQRDPIPSESYESIKALSISSDSRVLSIANSRNLLLWDLKSGRREKQMSIESGFQIERVAIDPTSNIIATTSLDVPQGGFEPPDGWINFQITRGEATSGSGFVRKGESVNDIAFSSDGKLLASAWSDKSARLIDTATAKQVGESFHHLDSVQAVAISRNGSLLASATRSDLQIWSVTSGKLLGEKMPLPATPSIVAFSPDGKRVTVVMDQQWQIWDLATRCTVNDTLWYESTIGAIEFLQTGQSLAIASAENVHFVQIPQPIDEDARRILLSVEVRTASTIDSGVMRALSENEWLKKRNLLEQGGGDCLGRMSSTK